MNAPTAERSLFKIEKLYTESETIIILARESVVNLIMRDWNAKIWKEPVPGHGKWRFC